jgi:hypothetical protein
MPQYLQLSFFSGPRAAVVLLNRFDVVGVIISPVVGSLSDKVDQVQHVGVAVIFAEDPYRSSSAVCTGWNTERNLIAVVMKRSTQQVFISNVKVIVLLLDGLVAAGLAPDCDLGSIRCRGFCGHRLARYVLRRWQRSLRRSAALPAH